MIAPFVEENYWSNCCWAELYDPGWTWEWLCSECGEHAMMVESKEFDLAFFDFTNGEAHIVRLEFNSWTHDDIEEAISEFFDENWIDFANVEYMFTEDKPIVAKDYRKRVDNDDE